MKNKSDRCPDCGAEVILKTGKYGYFWKCSKFPKCKFLASIQEGHPNIFSKEEYEDEKFRNELDGIYQASLNS